MELYFSSVCQGNPGVAGVAFLAQHRGEVVHRAGVLIPHCSSNEAEYQALALASRWAQTSLHRGTKVFLFGTSPLVVNQVTGKWTARGRLAQMRDHVRDRVSGLDWSMCEARGKERDRIRMLSRAVLSGAVLHPHGGAKLPR